MPLSTPPTAPQRGDRTTFAGRVDAFITWLIGFVSELNIFSANLNSIAAGGAYAIPYTFSGGPIVGSTGLFSLNGGAQSSSSHLYVNRAAANGSDFGALLDSLSTSSSTIKGSVRLQKLNDPSKWVIFDMVGLTAYGTYDDIQVIPRSSSGDNPFTVNDPVMLFFQRTGDKGDTGPLNPTPSIYVREEYAANTSPAALTTGTWNDRVLNSVKVNDISGASLASNLITLPAGTYIYHGSAPAFIANSHQSRLYNNTDAAQVDLGTTEYNATATVTRSILRGKFTIATAKSFKVQHFATSNSSAYTFSGMSSTGVFSEIMFMKVA